MKMIEDILTQNGISMMIAKKLDLALSVHGISFTEFSVMWYLKAEESGKMSRTNLASKIALTASGVTRILIPMEKNKLVSRESNPRDARQSLVKLSNTGEEVLKDSLATVEHVASEIFALLSDDEMKTFASFFNKIKC